MAARILVIEDNAANLELVRYLLSFSGHAVLEARDGAQGVDMALKHRPDLIVCDLQMPLLDGYQLLARLRREPDCSAIAVVAVTAFSMPNDRHKVMAAGFNGYLSKPIEPGKFVAQIESFLPAGLRAPQPGTAA